MTYRIVENNNILPYCTRHNLKLKLCENKTQSLKLKLSEKQTTKSETNHKLKLSETLMVASSAAYLPATSASASAAAVALGKTTSTVSGPCCCNMSIYNVPKTTDIRV
jgi:hypothetical protein